MRLRRKQLQRLKHRHRPQLQRLPRLQHPLRHLPQHPLQHLWRRQHRLQPPWYLQQTVG